ncbi:MAG: hypothetical protein V1244_05885, partial [Nitrospinaceae bacterium]|nr:hypothetical protein [Nitrospinaceae bacterium]
MDAAFTWFFVLFHQEFRRGNIEAFQTLMGLSLAHFFGCYNPKQFADFLSIPHQRLYEQLKTFSLYSLKEMLLNFMVHQAVEKLKPVLAQSAATQSRAGITLSVDNSVIDRFGRLLRCTYSWYSGRWKKVVNGQDLLGIVLTLHGVVIPLHLLFCAKQGRANTNKPDLLIAMLTRLKEGFAQEGIDLTAFPLTLDSWFVSQELRERLEQLGFTRIVLAGKGNYTFTMKKEKRAATAWKKILPLHHDQWGLDLPALRLPADSPTFGKVVLFFFQKSTTRTYYLIDFSRPFLRGAEIWHIWKQHQAIEQFWKILKSVLHIKDMQLTDQGLYTALLIKVIAYLLALRWKTHKAFSKETLTQLMRKISREYDL